MAWQVKALAAKPKDWSSIPRTLLVETHSSWPLTSTQKCLECTTSINQTTKQKENIFKRIREIRQMNGCVASALL